MNWGVTKLYITGNDLQAELMASTPEDLAMLEISWECMLHNHPYINERLKEVADYIARRVDEDLQNAYLPGGRE